MVIFPYIGLQFGFLRWPVTHWDWQFNLCLVEYLWLAESWDACRTFGKPNWAWKINSQWMAHLTLASSWTSPSSVVYVPLSGNSSHPKKTWSAKMAPNMNSLSFYAPWQIGGWRYIFQEWTISGVYSGLCYLGGDAQNIKTYRNIWPKPPRIEPFFSASDLPRSHDAAPVASSGCNCAAIIVSPSAAWKLLYRI